MSEVKKPFDPRERYAELKAQVASGRGMTAREWDWFDARMKEWGPEEFEARRKQAGIKNAIGYFEKHLAPEGYVLLPPGSQKPTVEEIAEAIWGTTLAAICDKPDGLAPTPPK